MIITFFPDYAARDKREESLTLKALDDLVRTTSAPSKDGLPWLKFARFGSTPNPKTNSGSLRWDGNVVGLSGVVTDYDREEMTPEEAAERLDKAGIDGIIYTSPSHSDAKPRWRACCPFAAELPPDEHYRMVARLNGLFGGALAGESFTLSQSFYYGSVAGNPAHRSIVVEGTMTLDRCDELDLIAIGKPNGNGQHHAPAGDPEAAIGDIVAALDAIPNPISSWDLKSGTWNEWNNVGMAVWRASGGSEEGRAAFHGWSKKWSKKYDGDETDFRWDHYHRSPPDRIGFGTLVHLAREAVPDWTPPSQQAAKGKVAVFDAGDIEVAKIEPRGWLLGDTFCRKFTSGLIAPGAGGKTAVRTVQYLAVASGRNLTGEYVFARCRVLVVCLEDDLDEVKRRFGAAMLHHRVHANEIRGWLNFCTPRGLKLLQLGKYGMRVIGKLYEELRSIVAEHEIDLISIDPFVKSHGCDENDNAAIDDVCTLLGKLADEFNCGIDIVHHSRKGAALAGDADRARGASSLVSAGRLMRTLTAMTSDEAQKFGIAGQERQLVRLDDAKVNLTARSGEVRWFRIVGVPLGNRSALYPNGDNVQTAETWVPPDLWAGGSAATWDAIIAEIDAGMPDGRLYSNHHKATDRAAWPVVQKHVDRTEAQAREMIDKWIKSGALVVVEYEDKVDRKPRQGLCLNPNRRTDNEAM